jgi:hypothetical protein
MYGHVASPASPSPPPPSPVVSSPPPSPPPVVSSSPSPPAPSPPSPSPVPPPIPIAVQSPPLVAQTCRSGFTYNAVSNKCYMHVPTVANQAAAASNCSRLGARLAVVPDAGTNAAITSMCPSGCWLGLLRRDGPVCNVDTAS